MRLRTLRAVLPLVALTALAACGGGSTSTATNLPGAGASSAGAGAGKTVTLASANFTENEIIAEMYADVLEKAGYTVNRKLNIGSREVYLKAMKAGEVDVVPDYVGTLAQVLNQNANGPTANETKPIATSDGATTATNMAGLLSGAGLEAFGLSPAQDQNAYAVTKATADKLSLTKISDLAGKTSDLTFGGPPECQTRPQCIVGLKRVYDLTFGEFKALDAGGPLTIAALNDGTINVGLVFSSDGAVAASNLVVLADDKGLTPADNIITLARKGGLDDAAKALLTKVNLALTTEKLSVLNKRVGVDKEDPAAVAKDFLKTEGLA